MIFLFLEKDILFLKKSKKIYKKEFSLRFMVQQTTRPMPNMQRPVPQRPMQKTVSGQRLQPVVQKAQSVAQPVPQSTPPAIAPPALPTVPEKKKTKWWLKVIVIIVALAIGIVIGALW